MGKILRFPRQSIILDSGKLYPTLPLQPWKPRLYESQWLISIREEIDKARESEASWPFSHLKAQSIYIVPKILREVDDNAYTPQIVSLGPYHSSCPRLKEMNHHKWRALGHALDRTHHDISLYLNLAFDIEQDARACYDVSMSISSDDFIKTLVLDSIFLLEIFRGVANNKFPDDYDPHDPVFSFHNKMYSLQPDMLLLENQLPLFVLDKILTLQLGRHEPGLVAKLALNFFQPMKFTDETFASSDVILDLDNDISGDNSGNISSEALHCLDVFRLSFRFPKQKPSSQSNARPVANNLLKLFHRVANCMDVFPNNFLFHNQKPSSQLQLIHCVDDLRNAGIKFQRRRSDQFWDIQFKNGVLQIPRLCIQRTTKSLFLNLMAFELCHLEYNNYITQYVFFMDNLIDSEVDVKYLHEKGIIQHYLENDTEVADMFNRLTNNVNFNFNDFYLSDLYEQVNIYYNQRWNTWKASLSQKYFSNPWTIISLVAAVILLLLTFVQTLYSIYGYYKPN